MAKISNLDLWNATRKAFPQFASHTAEGTKEMFTEAGFEKLRNYSVDALDDFWKLSMRVWLNVINISHANDPLEDNGFGEYYDQPWGGYIQRMSIDSVKPISPAYKGLKDGAGPDPFVVRKPKTAERFWRQNFDYASLITYPDEFAQKQIFISEYGVSEFYAGVMEGLQNGYTIQKYENKLEALNAGINSTDTALQDSQHFTASLSAVPTEDEMKNFILGVNNVVEAMTALGATDGFNAMHFQSTQDKSRLKLLVRPGFKNALKVMTLSGIFHPDELNMDVDVIVVPHFGGLQPYKEAEFTTPLYPVYSELGEMIGYNEAEDQTEVTVETYDVFWKDPNANVNAILADKGVIFECRQNAYEVEPIRNPRGRYTNFWASSPNNTIAFDPLYNIVLFENESV